MYIFVIKRIFAFLFYLIIDLSISGELLPHSIYKITKKTASSTKTNKPKFMFNKKINEAKIEAHETKSHAMGDFTVK